MARAAPKAAADASHQPSVRSGNFADRSHHVTITLMTAQPRTTTLVLRTKAASSIAANPARPAQVRRRGGAPAAMTAHTSAPEPAASSDASVNVGM